MLKPDNDRGDGQSKATANRDALMEKPLWKKKEMDGPQLADTRLQGQNITNITLKYGLIY